MKPKATKKNSNKHSKTNWEKLATMSENEINLSDIDELDSSFFKNAVIRMPSPKDAISLRIDHDVIEWFKTLGKGYQTRINAVLRTYVNAKRTVPHSTRKLSKKRNQTRTRS